MTWAWSLIFTIQRATSSRSGRSSVMMWSVAWPICRHSTHLRRHAASDSVRLRFQQTHFRDHKDSQLCPDVLLPCCEIDGCKGAVSKAATIRRHGEQGDIRWELHAGWMGKGDADRRRRRRRTSVFRTLRAIILERCTLVFNEHGQRCRSRGRGVAALHQQQTSKRCRHAMPV